MPNPQEPIMANHTCSRSGLPMEFWRVGPCAGCQAEASCPNCGHGKHEQECAVDGCRCLPAREPPAAADVGAIVANVKECARWLERDAEDARTDTWGYGPDSTRYRERHAWATTLLALAAHVEALQAEKARLLLAAVKCAVPYEAILMDTGSRRWIAPEVWAHIEEAALAVRALLSSASGGRADGE